MLYYFSIVSKAKNVEVRRAVAVDAEDKQDAELHCFLQHEHLCADFGIFSMLEISALHYETICDDLEIEKVIL